MFSQREAIDLVDIGSTTLDLHLPVKFKPLEWVN
jgi:hypothetical protein